MQKRAFVARGLANNLFRYARGLLFFTLVISLISSGLFISTIGIDNAIAKKSSKKSSDRSSTRRDSSGRDTVNDNSFQQANEPPTTSGDQQVDESNVPLPLPTEAPTNNKFVIINFDDSHQSDYTYAKPILDKYGFKATFFEVCNWVEAENKKGYN